jgi:hypothetical protein
MEKPGQPKISSEQQFEGSPGQTPWKIFGVNTGANETIVKTAVIAATLEVPFRELLTTT